MLFLILYALATFTLFLAILGSIKAYEIKITINFILSLLIGLGAIIACLKLAMLSFSHYLIYGAFTALFMVFLTTMGKAKPVNGMVSCLLSFIFFPQFIAFTIFSILNMRTFLDKDG